MEEEKVSISYDKALQDIAGNALEVNMVQSNYDPLGERLLSKKREREADDKLSTVTFKSNHEIGVGASSVPIPASPSALKKYPRRLTYDV